MVSGVVPARPPPGQAARRQDEAQADRGDVRKPRELSGLATAGGSLAASRGRGAVRYGTRSNSGSIRGEMAALVPYALPWRQRSSHSRGPRTTAPARAGSG